MNDLDNPDEELKLVEMLLRREKEKELDRLPDTLTELQLDILSRLGYDEWQSLSTEKLANEHQYGSSTVSRQRQELIEQGIIEKTGERRGAEYRKTLLCYLAQTVEKWDN